MGLFLFLLTSVNSLASIFSLVYFLSSKCFSSNLCHPPTPHVLPKSHFPISSQSFQPVFLPLCLLHPATLSGQQGQFGGPGASTTGLMGVRNRLCPLHQKKTRCWNLIPRRFGVGGLWKARSVGLRGWVHTNKSREHWTGSLSLLRKNTMRSLKSVAQN